MTFQILTKAGDIYQLHSEVDDISTALKTIEDLTRRGLECRHRIKDQKRGYSTSFGLSEERKAEIKKEYREGKRTYAKGMKKKKYA